MPDTAYLELLVSYEAALEAAQRCLLIARTLTEAHRSGLRPAEASLDVYLASVERDEAQLAELREKLRQFKSGFRTH